MKYLFSLLLLFVSIVMFAQGKFQVIPLADATSVHVYGNMSGVILTVGEPDEVVVHQVLMVNGEDRSDLLKLEVAHDGNQLNILDENETQELLKKEFKGASTMIWHKPDANKYLKDYDAEVIVQAYIEVTVPADVIVTAETVYGAITGNNLISLPSATSTYGQIEVVFADNAKITGLDFSSEYASVDLTLPVGIAADLHLQTTYGSMYTDFDFPVSNLQNKAMADAGDGTYEYEDDIGKPLRGRLNGGGKEIRLESTYQNIYVRQK